MTLKYDGIPKEMGYKSKFNKKGASPRDRFNFYMGVNAAFNKIIGENNNNSVLVRYLLSTTAFHNIMIKDKEEENPYLERSLGGRNFLTPDITFLLYSSKADLEDRMKERPPAHIHEADVNYLIRVQDEF